MLKLGKYTLGWKLVGVNARGQRVSLLVDEPDWVITYKKYRWTRSIPGTLILCYGAFKAALRHLVFEWLSNRSELWLCLMKKARPVFYLCQYIDSGELKRFWFGQYTTNWPIMDVSRNNIVGAEEIFLLFRFGFIHYSLRHGILVEKISPILKFFIKWSRSHV